MEGGKKDNESQAKMEGDETCDLGRLLASPAPGEEIVISGMAGQFAMSDNMYELRDNLMNHVDMIGEKHRHWCEDERAYIYRSGLIKDLSRFDAAFFGIPSQEADLMCPMLRSTLERTYEAIMDAGVNPSSLKGSRTGIYLSSIYSEAESDVIYDRNVDHKHGLSVLRCHIPAKVAHWLGVSGPAFTVDSACASVMFALTQAYEDIRMGVVDAAVVGASNLCLRLFDSMGYDGLSVLNHDGKVKAFDQDADGFSRTDAIPVAFLQKAKDAKRIYATIVHAKTNCDGYKPEGIPFPGGPTQEVLYREFYEECKLDPTTIDFLEAHATATKIGDVVEMNIVERVFCEGRTIPLPVGSIKSNLGHPEPAAGLCSVAKVVISMETGIIPANLHYKTPKKEITGLINGKFKVITENTPLPGDLVAINSFGFGGSNAHVLLRRHTKVKENGGKPKDQLPRLVIASGRTENAVANFLDDVESRPVDAEYVALLQDLFATNMSGHVYRGYALLTGGDKKIRNIQRTSPGHRPIWFLFSGSGDHSINMARSLREMAQFSSLVTACDEALKPIGYSLQKILDSKCDDNALNSVEKSLVSTLVQIGVLDILTTVGITADGLLSHQAGEIACAYADGCLSAQQAMLMAYYLASMTQSNLQELTRNFKKVILEPRRRSTRWSSASVPEEDGRFAAPEYFCKCLLSSTLHLNAIHNVDENSVVIELGSPVLLDTIRTKSKFKTMRNVQLFPLASKSEGNDLDQGLTPVFSLLGRLYLAGLQPQLSKLYPAVNYPVSRGTPMISPLIGWEHSNEWGISGLVNVTKTNAESKIIIRMSESRNKFYEGHVIDGRNLFPATGYLVLVWNEFSTIHGSSQPISVVFRDLRLARATTIPENGDLTFIISIRRHDGRFEVSESGTSIVTGSIEKLEDTDDKISDNLELPKPVEGQDVIDLENRSIYKELKLRGYNYKDVFRGLITVDNSASTGLVKWNDNWVGFIDTLLQMRILSMDSRALYVPTGIDSVIIDIKRHKAELMNCITETVLNIDAWDKLDVVRAGGVEIRGLNASPIVRRKPLGQPVLERYQFLPHTSCSEGELSLAQTVRMCVHVMLENHLGPRIRVYELAYTERNTDVELLGPHILSTLEDLPLLQGEIMIMAKGNDRRVQDLGPGLQVVHEEKIPGDQSGILAVATNVINNSAMLNTIMNSLAADGCIIARETLPISLNNLRQDLQVLVDRTVRGERLLLVRKTDALSGSPLVINVTENNLSWLPQLQSAVKNIQPPQRVVLVAQGEPLSGIMGLFNCIRREPGGDLARCYFITDPEAPVFDPCHPMYLNQLRKDMAVNVLQDGQWGSYRHLLLDPPHKVTATHGYNNVRLRGDLSSLTWFEGPITDLNDADGLIHVYYSALNFRDVMMSTGKLAPDSITKDRTQMDILQGFEFSGRDTNGKRVMGMSSGGCLANIIGSQIKVCWEVPDLWTLEEAATVPIVYSTAIYALKVEGRLQPGDSVLIHAGSGGVGQAAINYCLHHGCTVFTTVGTPEKREFIKKQFPQIRDDHIGFSRDTSFEEFIMSQTNGRGVDVVLNSLAEEKLFAGIRCLAKQGRFLEIGKFDMSINTPLALDMFSKQQSFHSIMLDIVFYAPPEERKYFYDLLAIAIKEGSVRPLGRTVFDTHHVEDAFRFMAAGRHIGKVLVQIRPEEDKKVAKPRLQPMEVQPRFHCDPRLTYIVLGGLGGFGLELTDWLVLRGARKLVLTSRRGISNGYQSSRVRIWRSYGATVVISTHNTSTIEGSTALLNEANAIAPVGGIFNLAVVLRDALLENQTEETFQESFRGKAISTRHLDALSRRLCPQLQQFVVFSSVSCGRGNAGQTNYGMSNSVMERICEARVRDGLPAVAIQWGAVGDVGLVADMQEEQHELVIGGTLQQRISSCLEVMDDFLKQSHPVVASMVVAEKRAGGSQFDNIVDCVANILGLRDVTKVSSHSTLTELGMDSMMVVEIKQALERDHDLFLSTQELRNLTMQQLRELASSDRDPGTSPSTQEVQDNTEMDDSHAMELVLNFIGNKEDGSEIVHPLPSLTTSSTSNPVLMIPGIGGIATNMEPLSKNLASPCLALQLCYHNPSPSVAGMALHLLQHVREKLVPGTPFTLIGHSFGGLVALEMASLLETDGWTGRVFLLDSTPDLILPIMKYSLGIDTTNDITIEIGLLCRIFQFLSVTHNVDTTQITAELTSLPSWDERANKILELIPEVERDYQRAIMNALLVHLKAINSYRRPEDLEISSPVTLIRPLNTQTKMDGDCGLSKFCRGPVAMYSVEGDHSTMLQSPATAEIINQILKG